MTNIFRLADSQMDCLTRAQGKQIRSRLEKELQQMADGDKLKIDFEDVDVMTPSFADECLGKLAEKVGVRVFRNRISLVNPNETIRMLVNSVLAERLSGRA